MNTMAPCNISIPRRVWWGIVALWLFSLNSACFDIPCINDTRCPSDTPRCVRGICQFSESTSDGGNERDTEPFDPLRCVTGAKRPCYPTNTQGCRLDGGNKYVCQAPCRAGFESCVGGTWSGLCQGFVGPSNERCNSQDDDCDGMLDNGFANLGQPCDVGKGECKTTGKYVCKADGSATECDAKSGQPAKEICDGKDNDCNGSIDDAPNDAAKSLRRSCYSGDANTRNKGLCKDGYQLCKNGAWDTTCHSETLPIREICDGKDNDCDGWIDNTFINVLAQPCTTGIGECKNTGYTVCSPDGLGVQCNAKKLPPKPETCNNKDDDCNGKIDDNVPNCLQHCQTRGDCPTTYPYCQDGRCIRLCKVHTDCDDAYWCQQGYCQNCPNHGKRSAAENCNGKDDDCDGQIDNGFANLGQSCNVGQGECTAPGKYVCKTDGSGTVCNAKPGIPAKEIYSGSRFLDRVYRERIPKNESRENFSDGEDNGKETTGT